MLKINAMFEKENFLKDSKKTLFLVELEGLKSTKIKTQKTIPLNLSIAIDVSGSMASGVNHDFLGDPFHNMLRNGLNDIYDHHPYIKHEPIKVKQTISKIEQAKMAAIKAIENMQDGDFVSIVLFDHNTSVLVPATKLNSSQRMLINDKIKKIGIGGSTDLHSGWLGAATEVSKNISSKSINRVLLLTDGQTNSGIRDPKEIESNVRKMFDASITTTCFGIGQDFNEDLLLAISNNGGGNFYYVDDDNKLQEMFEQEFSGFKNLAASQVRVDVVFEDGVTIQEQLNQLIKSEKGYEVADVYNNKKSYLLFKLDLPEKLMKINAKVIVSYKDENSVEHIEQLTLENKAISKKKWEQLAFNQEVKVQETLLIVANNKIKASEAISNGNLRGANDLLAQSQMFVNNAGITDDRLVKEFQDIQNAVQQGSQGGDLKKIISTQSYNMRYNR